MNKWGINAPRAVAGPMMRQIYSDTDALAKPCLGTDNWLTTDAADYRYFV